MKKKLTALLALCLSLTLTIPSASALTVEEGRELLQTFYVDEIPPEVLEKDTLEEMLQALGDPYTEYLSPEEYQVFLEEVNGEQLVGIGITIRTVFENGYPIISVIPDSPAEQAGLKAGDCVLAVDGVTMTADTEPLSLIGGEEGTQVVLTVRRDREAAPLTIPVTRAQLTVPTVQYEQLGEAGYLDCTHFGERTAEDARQGLEALDEQTSVWLLDLRANPGGRSDVAADLISLFAGDQIASFFQDSTGRYTLMHAEQPYEDHTDKPLLILTSAYSASASELFLGAARVHGFGLSIGERTFGKGVAQVLLDETSSKELFHGDAMKITSDRFYAPDGATNQYVGVIPTLLLSRENTAAAALLLSAGEPQTSQGYLKLALAGQTLYIKEGEAVQEDSRAAFTELLEALPPVASLYEGTDSNSWIPVTPEEVAGGLGLDFHKRTFPDVESSPYRPWIDTLALYGLISGRDDGGFHPKDTITRAEFAALLDAALRLPVPEDRSRFSDVSEQAWYAKPVAAMAARGFLSGRGDGTFAPDDTITCQEAATVLHSVASWCSILIQGRELEPLSEEESVQYHEFADWARIPARGIDDLGGLIDGAAPTDVMTREMTAYMLCRTLEGIDLLWTKTPIPVKS